MEFVKRKLEGMFDVRLNLLTDHRGFLARTYDADLFAAVGIHLPWLQHTLSYTERRNTLRGLHAQKSAFSEAKLLLPLSGQMFWVSVDLRKESPTFGQWDTTLLDPEKGEALYVPRGFGHGCLSMTDKVLLHIFADNRFSHEHGFGIRWDDPELAIAWPEMEEPRILSDAHLVNPGFRHFLETVGGL